MYVSQTSERTALPIIRQDRSSKSWEYVIATIPFGRHQFYHLQFVVAEVFFYYAHIRYRRRAHIRYRNSWKSLKFYCVYNRNKCSLFKNTIDHLAIYLHQFRIFPYDDFSLKTGNFWNTLATEIYPLLSPIQNYNISSLIKWFMISYKIDYKPTEASTYELFSAIIFD